MTITSEHRLCPHCGGHIENWKEVFCNDLDKGKHVCFKEVKNGSTKKSTVQSKCQHIS